MKRTSALLGACVAAVAGFAIGYLPHANHGSAKTPLYFVDPMHPGYRSAHPGKAPDCGMDLVPVFAEDVAGELHRDGHTPGVLDVDAATLQQYGVKLARVAAMQGSGSVHLFGRVAADETRVYRVNLGTDGYVKETHGDAVGNLVHKNQRLATVYSPEFLSVVGGYLSANERTTGSGPNLGPGNMAPTANAASAQARADRLRNLGMSEAQIEEISATRKIPEDVYLVAPNDGLIMGRQISPGSRFDRHTDLYTIADLSRVWIVAQAFGAEADSLRPGAIARVRLPDTGEMFQARVSDALPEVDPATHALTIRLEAANPRLRLRPGMFVDVENVTPRASALLVPADAVVDSGTSKHVYVQTSDGVFQAREVRTGPAWKDEVRVVSGLSADEIVASSGTFLLDSESRLRVPAITNLALKNASEQQAPAAMSAGGAR